ncbi:hypothetical protein ANACAC_03562 [Anaerostipes caccae L1-92]|uniref:Uncharacterized protein n=1 Tax=Anaerostipes caccae (strain DSM 14662 / CCUG 47493 / JCM 13470 / NCIMB 13811 / L1-92) TaxID=411490 RepID=B0MIV7_ANACD|nr:hypothetical protein ANACAC_03562 [Anaerostipes caccae L1-92]
MFGVYFFNLSQVSGGLNSYNLKSKSGKEEISYERKKKCFRNVRM